jgi:RHS repeat-associated protein
MTNASGAELESTEYLPFGSQRSHSGTNTSDYRYTDQEFDSENGLYNYNARLYDPFIGRFITPDTIVPEPYNPQSLNRYSYCLNNPLIYTDPSGHEETEYELEEIVVIGERLYWFEGMGFYGWVTLDELFSFMSLYSTSEINPYEYPLLQEVSIGGGGGSVAHAAAKADKKIKKNVNPTQDNSTWQDIVDGKYVGTGYGEDATQYYADKYNNADTWYEKTGWGVAGCFAALWTPDTYLKTAGTLAAGYSVAGWAARTGGPAAIPNLSFGSQGNNYFRVMDTANRLGFRIDKAHVGHAAKNIINKFIQSKFPHPHFWSW